MMLAPEKRTKFIFLNHATSSAILRMLTSGFEPRTPTDDPAFGNPLCLQVSHGLPVSQQAPALLLYSCSSYRCQKGIPLMR